MNFRPVIVGGDYLSWWRGWLQPAPLELDMKTSIRIMESWPACFVEVVQSSRCSIDIQIDYFNYQNQFSRIEWNIWKCISKGHLKLAQTTNSRPCIQKSTLLHMELSLSCIFAYIRSEAQSTQLEPGKTTTKLHCSHCSHESLNKLNWYSS